MKWVAVVLLLAVAVGGYFYLTPHVERHHHTVVAPNLDFERIRSVQGWGVLRPWAAWPVLVAYFVPVIVFAGALGWMVAKSRMAEEHQALAKHEAAAEARLRQGEARKQEAQAALEQVTQREREADGRIEAAEAQAAAAEFRLERSVKTNIGLHRQVQKLKKPLDELGEQATMGHC